MTTASEVLTRALIELANRGSRPRCGDPETHDLWLSEDAEERATAATWCTGCPILTECHEAAEAGDERFGVWAGVDRTPTPKRDQCRTPHPRGSKRTMPDDLTPLDPEDIPADAWSLKRLDPDWEAVPPEAAELDGQQVWIDGEPGTWCVVPGLHGHARRLREGLCDDDEGQP